MTMECYSSTPDKNNENVLKIVKDNAKRSHSKTLVKKAKLSLFKKSCVQKSLIPNVDLDETGQFQENQTTDFRIHVKPVRKPQKNVQSKQEVFDQTEGTLNFVEEKIEGEITGDENSQTCPTCQKSMPSSKLSSHIRLCLKQQFTLVKTNSQDNNEKSSDYQLCQICQKDISHMNSTRRSLHVNSCMDQKEAGLQEEENKNRLLTDAKTAILDCPICGKSLKTSQSRKSHMKKCSVVMNVTTEKLLALIKNQEEERNVEIAAGVIPNSLRLLRLKSVSSAANEEKKSRRVAQPKNQLDEETQLALALSTSIAEQQRIQDQAITGQKLSNPSKKTRNRKKCAEDIPLILKLNKEEAKKRIADRVTQLLLPKTPQNSQENIVVTPPDSSRLNLTDMSVECEILRSNLLQPRLWTESGLSKKDENGIDKFYVSALMPSVSIATVKAGSKLRRMSTIPGRRNSEELEKEILMKQQKNLKQRQLVDQKKNELNSTLKSQQPVSSSPIVTQTAVLLAELAAEADCVGSHLENSTTQQQNDHLHHSGFCPEEPIEIHEDIVTSSVVSLQQSLLDMVDNPTDSDVTIVTRNRPIPAHKIFLRSRCPQILQKMTEGNKIDLSRWPIDIVMAVLKYVYAGSILLHPGSLEDVLQLSSSLGLEGLENICQTVIKFRQDHPGTKDTATSYEEENEGLDVLDNLWSSSSDSDSEDEEVKGHSEGGEVKGKDDCEEDDWREMFYTQREKIKRQNSHDLLDNEGENYILSDNSEDLHIEIETFKENVATKDGTCDYTSDDTSDDTSESLSPNSNSNKGENSSDGSEIEKDGDNDTRDTVTIEYKSNLLDFKAVSESLDSNHAVEITKTDDTCSDSEDNCSILDIVDKRRRSNSNSQSSFKDNLLQEQCKSKSLPNDVTEGVSKDSNLMSKIGQGGCQKGKVDPNNSVKATREMAASTVTDLSANLFESDDELFSEGEQNDPEEGDNFTQKLGDCPSNSQNLSDANSIDNPICLNSESEVEDEDINSIGRELQKLESEIGESCDEEKDSVEKDIYDTVDSFELSPNGGQNKTEKSEAQIVKPKKNRFKFVSTKDKIGKNIQGFAPPDVLISDADVKDGLTDKSDSEKISYIKRKIDCMESPKSKDISKTPLIQNKRYKVSTPNSESNSIVGHDSLLITPIQNQSRQTFMLTTPTSSIKTLENKPQKTFVAIPIKMIDEFSPKRSSKKGRKSWEDESSLLPVCRENIPNLPDTETKPDSDSDIEIVDDNLQERSQCVGQSPKFGGTQVKKSSTYALSGKDENKSENKNEEVENGETGIDDVWDGFEDVGYDHNIYAAEIQSPDNFTINQTSMDKGDQREVNLDEDNDVSIPQEHFQGVINDLEDEEIIQAAELQTNFKTPTLSESAKKRKAKKPWVAPSPFTPLPNYDAMNTPQLQKQINKYGLRPACKKRMKDVLTTIYHETHQYETDSDCEVDVEKLELLKQKAEKTQQEKEIKSKKSTKGTKKAPAKQTKTVNKPKKITQPPIQTINFPPEGSSDDQLSSSQSSDISDLPEESILTVQDDEDQEGPKCSKSELHKKLTEYIKSNSDIHIDTLQYIPLEFDVFKKRMTENGIKCSMEKLQEYFDEKCISFTMKNNRKPRKQKRKPKQRRMKQPVDV